MIDLVAARRRREREKLRRARERVREAARRRARARREIATYRPIDEERRPARERVLVGLRFHDWISARDLFEALEVPSDDVDRAERARYAQALTRLVRAGLVELRGPRGAYEYHLTAAGVAEADRLLGRRKAS